MRHPPPLFLFLLAGCGAAGDVARPGGDWRPAAAVVFELPAGSAVLADVLAGLPDEPVWRAAAVWWHEALRQTVRWELRDSGAGDLPTLRLAVDPQQRALAAFLVGAGPERALAGDSFADGDLPAAIDRLAFAARTALGEPATAPVPVAACVSANPAVANAVHDAWLLLRSGSIQPARQTLLLARRDDGASPAVLDGLAAVELLRGDAATAERMCLEALGYQNRLQPTTEHRLARTLLLARASLHPAQAGVRDRELLQLGTAAVRERPHDLQTQLTLAIARNFTDDFAGARPLLERLRVSEPEQAIVAYHLGWSCLATGDAAAASRNFDAAALRLPLQWVALPRAIARYSAGDERGLADLFEELDDAARTGRGPVHEVTRMRAAHAVLAGKLDDARRLMLDDLHWLLQNPSLLARAVGEFAEQGAVLVRLGGGEDLRAILLALQGQRPSAALADAVAFLSGMTEVARTRQRATAVEAVLARGGESAWSSLLAAFAHELRGEALDMQTELARAARLSDSPMTKALLARSLRAVGRTSEADTLQQALRRELLAIHLRQPPQHPLLGPELAFAYQAQ